MNPANSKLQHKGALAAYIVKRGGYVIQRESNEALFKLENFHVTTGNALATGAGALPFVKIIHAVGPVWDTGGPEKEILLRSAVSNSIELAGILGLKSLALPAISSGAFGFPRDLCAQCFFEQVIAYAEKKAGQKLDKKHPFALKTVSDIRFTNIDDETVSHFINYFDKYSDRFTAVDVPYKE